MIFEETLEEKTQRTMETLRKEKHMKEMEADNVQLRNVIGAYQAREGRWQEALEETQTALCQAEMENTRLRNEIDAYQTREGEMQAELEAAQAALFETEQDMLAMEYMNM